MKTSYLFISLIVILFLSNNCTGIKGEDGLDGNANVGTAIYDIGPSTWVGNIDGFVTSLNVPELTEDIYENGAVLVYMLKNENQTNQSFNQLPYTWLYNSITEYMDYDAFIGRIDITLRWVDNGVNSTETPTDYYTFKVIVIAGTPLSTLKMKTDISNPDAVIEYLSGKAIY